MNVTMRLEGFDPDASDLAIQAKYVGGEATWRTYSNTPWASLASQRCKFK